MRALNETLKELVADACTHPPRSAERQRYIGEIYRLVVRSGKLWKENVPYYTDAFQEAWEHCCDRLDEYDPTRSAVITWIDNHIKWKLKEWRRRQRQHNERTTSGMQTEEGRLSPVDNLASNPGTDEAEQIWQTTLGWVRTDPDGILRATCFRGREDINAQTLFLRRFPSETPWQDIAHDFDLNRAEATDLPKFYNRKCLPLLRDFGAAQGYLDPKTK